jgi:DNA-binding CsgD family transcriptional regulator
VTWVEVDAPGRQMLGREEELSRIESFLRGETATRALVLDAEAGAGKTTLWDAGIELARRLGLRVLSARPSGAEAKLSFAALTDLLEDVDIATLTGVPTPQRRALEIALLRAEPGGAQLGSRAIATGLLNALRELAQGGPLLVAVDDVQWLDRPSAEALAFAARRLDDADVRFLLAKRSGSETTVETALVQTSERLGIAPLSLGATRALLFQRLGLSPPRRVLRQVFESAGGNPLFTLELGRMLAERGAPEIGQDMPVPAGVEELIGVRIRALPRGPRRLLLALALSPDLRTSQLQALAEANTVEQAVENGLLLVEGDRVRPSHPLLAAAARERARAPERRELHRELADLVSSEGLRARHLALATTQPDAELARRIAAAAEDAAARGARLEAVELAEHALRLTPRDGEARSDRVLALASHLETAGELQRVTDLLHAELDSIPAGIQRARAWLQLSEGAHVRHLDEYRRHLECALAEARDDPALQALVVANMSSAVISVEQIDAAEVAALEVLLSARLAGPDVERQVLFALAWARGLRGLPVDDLCQQWDDASPAPGYLARSPERVAGQRLVWRGSIESARERFLQMLALSDERAEPASSAWARLHLCELALRTGDCAVVSQLLDEWAQTSDGDVFVIPTYQRCRALLAAGRGFGDEADRLATDTIERALEIGTQWDWLEALRAKGIAAMLAHKPAQAAESFRAVWEHVEREGVADPGVFPVAPDLVEALVELGETVEAGAVTKGLQALAEEQQHPWGLATAKRCAGLVSFDQDRLADAAGAYEALGLRFDQARTLLALGRGERRLRKWGAARGSLERAAAIFDELGSPGWAEQARAELGRVGARRPSPTGELTPTERRTAELAADGLSNKEIAQALYVTVHTVEVHLSRAYAKLGVRSRSQLVGRLDPQ